MGRPAYDPSMVLALLLYAYSQGNRSSRRIERECRADVAYRANRVPDHSTIAEFRCRHERAIADLFGEVLGWAGRRGHPDSGAAIRVKCLAHQSSGGCVSEVRNRYVHHPESDLKAEHGVARAHRVRLGHAVVVALDFDKAIGTSRPMLQCGDRRLPRTSGPIPVGVITVPSGGLALAGAANRDTAPAANTAAVTHPEPRIAIAPFA